jgi:hypothetical protein
LSARDYPRKNEYGQPTYGCRWCGEQREYDPDYWIIGSFCSFSCHAAHGFYLYGFMSIMFTFFTFMTLDLVLRYWSLIHGGVIFLTIVFGLISVGSLYGVTIGRKVRKETPRHLRTRERYDPKIRA